MIGGLGLRSSLTSRLSRYVLIFRFRVYVRVVIYSEDSNEEIWELVIIDVDSKGTRNIRTRDY